MYEFIVWDKENYFGEDNQFYTKEELKIVENDFAIFELDFISSEKPFISTYLDDGEYGNGWKKVEVDILYYIGKTDINDKKIYADCSIVEFKVFGIVPLIKGYFIYDDATLKYKIKLLENDTYVGTTLSYDVNISCLKIIDTIQENKLGLIGASNETS